jgi:Transposase DDE domain group 1
MVKSKNRTKQTKEQDRKSTDNEQSLRVVKITAQTPYGECSERLTAFGGLLALVKFLDLLGFENLFEKHYVHPKRQPKLGGYRMVLGILMLLFIGFQRVGHFAYIRSDPMLRGILRVKDLPAVSTFWRYLRSMTIVQSFSILKLNAALRCKAWKLCEYHPRKVTVDIDTTVSTVYGEIEGARKGHNTKHRGKKGLRPVLCFVAETREFLCGTQRRGKTITIKEVVRQIKQIPKFLPDYVEEVKIRGDGEFIGWESVKTCIKQGYKYTFGNRGCKPPWAKDKWYRHKKYEYNECDYKPTGWEKPCRFVVMRIRKDDMGDRQLNLLDSENYAYRVFVTNDARRPHNVIKDYDKRASVENCIKEAQHEGLLAIPSKSFQSHHAFFQIVMLAYNLWRWMKILAGHAERKKKTDQEIDEAMRITMPDHTIRIARLKMLYVAAKILYHGNRDKVAYSVHEQRAAGLIDFLRHLDLRREKAA